MPGSGTTGLPRRRPGEAFPWQGEPVTQAREQGRVPGRGTVRPGAVLPLALGAALAGPLLLLGAVGAASVPGPAVQAAPAASAPATTPPTQPVRRTVVPVVQRGDGRTAVVAGSGPVRGEGPLQRYTVEVEGGLGVDPAAFAAAVETTLADPHSWGAGGRLSFRRVEAGPVAFRVVLASPDTTDRLCRPLDTGGSYSCANEGRAVINARRWLRGADAYGGDLAGYRQYVVNHEVGHTLGHGHARCPASGAPAPVMVQQTKGLGGCAKNPWPFP